MTIPFSIGTEPIAGLRVRHLIGRSPGADTYRVVDSKDKLRCLKVMAPSQAYSRGFDSSGTLIELAIAESLDHPGIPNVIATGRIEDTDQQYALFDLVPGETLNYTLEREFTLPPATAIDIVVQVSEAVAYLHGLVDPVFHNRLRPDNILLGIQGQRENVPFLIGFGHSRRASDGGSDDRPHNELYYLPNEALDETPPSSATDVFALGALLFRILFGVPPWHHTRPLTSTSVLRDALYSSRRDHAPIPTPGSLRNIDRHVLEVIQTALAFRPRERFTDGGAFSDALRSAYSRNTRGPVSTDVGSAAPVASTWFTGHGFAAVGGMNELKETLVRDVITPLQNPDRYRQFGLDIPNGILLYGPPGCGKTFVAERFAEELGFTFRRVNPASLASIFVHGTQEKIARLFNDARESAPCLVFLDEVDAMIPSRSGLINHSYANEVNEWLVGMNDCGAHGVFVMAATNQPGRLDPAALRRGRFDKLVYVGPPDFEARKEMFGIFTRNRPIDSDLCTDKLAEMTTGWAGSDIRFVVDEAARDSLAADDDAISMSTLVDAVKRIDPSLTRNQIVAYEEMRRKFEGDP